MEKWKYKKKVLRTNLIVVAVFLIFASIFFYIDTRKSKQLAHRLKEKYPCYIHLKFKNYCPKIGNKL
jgi:CHASE3 domain sensor protein